MKKLKILICIFLNFYILGLHSIAQNSISGTLDLAQTATTERNFVGFNSGQGYLEMIYNKGNANANLAPNAYLRTVMYQLSDKITFRFAGGTSSNYYYRYYSGFGNGGSLNLFGDVNAFLPPNISSSNRDILYNNYSNYNVNGYPNAKSNIIFPYINSITDNLTKSSNSTFVLNLTCHYRNVNSNGYYIRTETLIDTNKYKNINSLSDFHNSTLSSEFKKLVLQNISSFITLNSNKVITTNIEFGNELYGYYWDDNIFTGYSNYIYNNIPLNPSDTKCWIRDDGTSASINDSYKSLWTLAHLCRLYRVLINDTISKLAINDPTYSYLISEIKYGICIAGKLNSGFNRYNNFFLNNATKNYIGSSGYILHLYCDHDNYFINVNLTDKSTSTTSTLDDEFNRIRDTLEIAYRQRTLSKDLITYINNFPLNSELWVTEWNLMFDWDNLKKVGNTMLHSLYYFDAMFNYFDINSNYNLTNSLNKSNIVKTCNYHVPYSGNNDETWYAMTRFPIGYNSTYITPETTTNTNASDIRYNATYYSQLLLKPLFMDTAIRYVKINNGGFNSTNNNYFRTFVKDVTGKECNYRFIYIYYNNKSDIDYSISLNSYLSNYLGSTNSSYCLNSAITSYLYANNLYASMGKTTFRSSDLISSDPNISIQRVYNENINNFDNVQIRKYSQGYIKIKLNLQFCCNLNQRNSKPTDITTNELFKIYPNPSEGKITFSSGNNNFKTIEISDAIGKIIYKYSYFDSKLIMDMSTFPKGIYYYKISDENCLNSGKFVLQ